MKSLPKIDYQAVFNKVPGLYLILLTDLTIVEVSEAYAKATMTKRSEIIGKNLFEIFPDNPEDSTADGVANLRGSLNFVLRNKTAHTMAVQKYDIRKPNGKFEIRYWSPLNKPVFDSNNDIAYIIHRVEDVTDFIRLEDERIQNQLLSSELQVRLKEMEIEIIKRSREIQQMNAQLEQKVTERTNHLKEANETIKKNIAILTTQKKQLEDFCNIISHNLRAPLVNISMLVEMIAEDSDEEEKRGLVEKLNIASQNLNEVFNELVESIQISQDTEIPSKKLALETYLQKTISGLQGQINKTKATIEVHFDLAPHVHYPPKYLYSILHNLVSNSLKYHSPNREPIIKITSKKTANSIILAVSDNGLGIDLKKNKDNLFKIRKVFHSHPDAKGFGLFITKSQVEAMNGKIWLESTPDVGTTFFVEFKNQKI
ncbi:PAS domain-containing sensor histidine kinase [Flavobacterium sp.]|uniref:PAS domain-containing sensor histidine kinase n=1 Tax=Flavobacterium sp. TaxID=239 RepID=UPI002FDA33B8